VKRGTRELVNSRFPNHIIVYRVTADAIEMLNVWHAAQDWH